MNVNVRSILNRTVELEHIFLEHDALVVAVTETCLLMEISDDKIVSLA